MSDIEEYYDNIEELIYDDFYKLGVEIEDIIEDIIQETKEIEFKGSELYKFAEAYNLLLKLSGVEPLKYSN